MTKLAVMVSGVGSILEAILESGLQVSLVVADRQCRGLKLAADAGIPVELVERSNYGHSFDRLAYSHRLAGVLKAHHIDLVAMAGFMTVLDKPIFDHYEGKILNTHPSLLPAFAGERAVQNALDYGVKLTGCTIHIATIKLDDGPILAQEAVPVLAGDTAESLQERIKQVERRLYPETIRHLITKASPV
ncbi:MAG TPA: phosphoribosylglycinamide formyltransferase [Candidatus Saccharimonadia bacterium]|nr:phosphoribosylglycinamide formyltransferase [Candidatus Saccharimonadia bacterium]